MGFLFPEKCFLCGIANMVESRSSSPSSFSPKVLAIGRVLSDKLTIIKGFGEVCYIDRGCNKRQPTFFSDERVTSR